MGTSGEDGNGTYRSHNQSVESGRISGYPSEKDQDSDDDNMSDKSNDFSAQNNLLNYGDFKDDRQIVKNAAENDKYNLVERPKYLLGFELKDQEADFMRNIFQ